MVMNIPSTFKLTPRKWLELPEWTPFLCFLLSRKWKIHDRHHQILHCWHVTQGTEMNQDEPRNPRPPGTTGPQATNEPGPQPRRQATNQRRRPRLCWANGARQRWGWPWLVDYGWLTLIMFLLNPWLMNMFIFFKKIWCVVETILFESRLVKSPHYTSLHSCKDNHVFRVSMHFDEWTVDSENVSTIVLDVSCKRL